MKYILINDLFTAGGSEVQSIRELNYFFKKGHDVLYITFDPNLKYHESKQKGHINLTKGYTELNRYICNKTIFKELVKIIDEFNPDFIHLNNTYLYAPTVYKAVKDYFCIQTIRDYSYVCVKSTCILSDGSICKGIKNEKCIKRCLPYNPKDLVIFIARYIALKNNKKLREKAINKFLCPSQKLTDYCNEHGFDTDCVNNPFDFNVVKDFKKRNSNKKIYLYYGVVTEKKGILKLIEAFKIFSRDKEDVELHIVGKLKDLTIDKLRCDDKIKYLNFMPYNEIIKKLQTVYSVVVPSLWIENYPNTVLEGFATDCIVLGSDRGGIPEQVNDSNRIFDVMNLEDILRVLNYSYSLKEREIEEILKKQHNYLNEHNRLDVYYNKILLEIQEVKNSDS